RCARRSDDTEAGWSEVASVDPTEARNSHTGFRGRPTMTPGHEEARPFHDFRSDGEVAHTPPHTPSMRRVRRLSLCDPGRFSGGRSPPNDPDAGESGHTELSWRQGSGKFSNESSLQDVCFAGPSRQVRDPAAEPAEVGDLRRRRSPLHALD